MASGRLGAIDLAAATATPVYTVPASTLAAISVNLCNRNASSVAIRLALSTTDTPAAEEYLEYETLIPGNSLLERTGLLLDAGKRVVAYSSAANVNVVVVGVEESA